MLKVLTIYWTISSNKSEDKVYSSVDLIVDKISVIFPMPLNYWYDVSVVVSLHFQMVEATTQLNYTLNAKVTAANTTTIITTGTANNVKATTVTIPANITVESATDFNMVAANCNTNVCFFCQKTFTNVYNCRRHIRTHSGEKVDHYFYSTVIMRNASNKINI